MADDRWIELEGAVNVRDLGGLPLVGGGEVARGVIVRADNLQDLTEADVRRLVDELGVRDVVDLRTEYEDGLEGPGPMTREPAVTVRLRSLIPETGGTTDLDADAVLPWQLRHPDADPDEAPAVRAYLGYLRDKPDEVVAALRDVLGSEGTTLVHCAAGKDRTGVVCALAAEVAGVERDAVVEDYALTDTRLQPIVDRLLASPTYAAEMSKRDLDSHRPHADAMARLLELLDQRHGGAEGWLAEHGFGADEVAALRARLRGQG